MELESNVMIARKITSKNLLKISQIVAAEIGPLNSEHLERLQLHNVRSRERKTEWIKGRQEKLSKIKNRKAMMTMTETKYPIEWPW